MTGELLDSRIWIVRAGPKGTALDDFRSNGVVAVGWREVGANAGDLDASTLARLFAEQYPKAQRATRGIWLAQLKRFVREIQIGDPVATYDATHRTYLLGVIKTEAAWRDNPLPRFRRVTWTHCVNRDVLSQQTKNALGAIGTLFRASEPASRELRSRATEIV